MYTFIRIQHSRIVFNSLRYCLVQHAPCLKIRNIEETKECRSVSPWMLLSFCCAAGSLLLCMAPGCSCLAAFLLRPAPCRCFVLPSSVGHVLEVPSRPQVRPGPALAEGQLHSCTAPHAWPQACSWRHTTLQARARCSGRSTSRHQVWGSGLVSGRGRISIGACGTYVYACDDGHAHAASSSHRLSCMHIIRYISIGGAIRVYFQKN